jgi:pimeloyl-ACP methyl ester carboxylesterase
MFISFGDGKIHYTDSGQGDVIVLLHGYLETSEIWDGFSRKLSSGFRVLAIDLPGHGLSDTFGEINSMEFMASAVKSVIDSEGINKFFLTGHSMGGYATLAFLQLFPEYLSGYSLFHSHPFADPPEVIEKRKQSIGIIEAGQKAEMIPDFINGLYAQSYIGKLNSAVSRSIELALATQERTIIADLKGMMARPARVKLIEECKVPFLWMLGAMDSHINYVTVQQKVKLPSSSKVTILNNSGHMGFIEEEDLSVRIVTHFIKGLI